MKKINYNEVMFLISFVGMLMFAVLAIYFKNELEECRQSEIRLLNASAKYYISVENMLDNPDNESIKEYKVCKEHLQDYIDL